MRNDDQEICLLIFEMIFARFCGGRSCPFPQPAKEWEDEKEEEAKSSCCVTVTVHDQMLSSSILSPFGKKLQIYSVQRLEQSLYR